MQLYTEQFRTSRISTSEPKIVEVSKEGSTLFRADCLDVLPRIKSKSVDLILTDLPYEITACSWDVALPMDKLWNQYKRVIKPNGAIILTAVQPFAWKLCASNPEWFRYEIIWEKANGTNPMLVKSQPFRCHENILIFYEKQPVYNPQMVEGKPYNGFYDAKKKLGEAYGTKNVSRHRDNKSGDRYPRSVQKFPREYGHHPTQKPVALMDWLIKSYSNEEDLVLDSTMGSGTTGVAAALNNRKFIGIEVDTKYFRIAKKRIWKAYD